MYVGGGVPDAPPDQAAAAWGCGTLVSRASLSIGIVLSLRTGSKWRRRKKNAEETFCGFVDFCDVF